MKSQSSKTRIVMIPISEIKVPEGRRSMEPSRVHQMAESIKLNRQLQPIGIQPDYTLVFGGHRLEAHKLLGLEHIAATILEYDDKLLYELAEIDENLQRNALSAAEEALALARRKKIYDELHPETVAGKAQASGTNRKQKPGKDVAAKWAATFTADTAAKTGLSRRTVERRLKIGKKLDLEAAARIRGSKIEKNQSELEALAALPPEKQKELAAQVQAGEIESVRDAKAGAPLSEKVKAGIRGLKAVRDALEELGVLADCSQSLTQIKAAFERGVTAVRVSADASSTTKAMDSVSTADNPKPGEDHDEGHDPDEGDGDEVCTCEF